MISVIIVSNNDAPVLKQRTLNSPQFDAGHRANLKSKVALEALGYKASLGLEYDNKSDPNRRSYLRPDALARMFAPLISAAADGLVRDVILSDATSNDQARLIADAAGCTIVESVAGWLPQVEAGAKFARNDWLLCLKAGAIAQAGWMEEAARFLERGDARERSGFFQVRYEEDGARARFAEAKAWARRDVLQSPLPEHGLLTTKAKLQSGLRGRPQLFRSALMYEFAHGS